MEGLKYLTSYNPKLLSGYFLRLKNKDASYWDGTLRGCMRALSDLLSKLEDCEDLSRSIDVIAKVGEAHFSGKSCTSIDLNIVDEVKVLAISERIITNPPNKPEEYVTCHTRKSLMRKESISILLYCLIENYFLYSMQCVH